MDHVGMDVHKKESQLYILADSGEIIERRIRTEPERFAAVLGTRPRARILIEASKGEREMSLGRCRTAAAKMAPPPLESPLAPASTSLALDEREYKADPNLARSAPHSQ